MERVSGADKDITQNQRYPRGNQSQNSVFWVIESQFDAFVPANDDTEAPENCEQVR